MRQPTLVFLGLLFISPLLSSCSSMDDPITIKRATCRTLKSQIIFNGATSNDRQSEIEQAQAPLQQRNYQVDNCAD